MATEELEPERVIQEFHRRIPSEQDLDAAEELLAPDYVEHNPILPDGAIRGREEMVAFWSELFDGVSDMEITEAEIVSEGNRWSHATLAVAGTTASSWGSNRQARPSRWRASTSTTSKTGN
jgi:predicted SnoaL-like aldol condensation-catalyzing enzyme